MFGLIKHCTGEYLWDKNRADRPSIFEISVIEISHCVVGNRKESSTALALKELIQCTVYVDMKENVVTMTLSPQLSVELCKIKSKN